MPIYRPKRRNTRLLRNKIFIYGSQKITWIVLVPGYRYIDSQQTNATEDKSPVKSPLKNNIDEAIRFISHQNSKLEL